MSRASSISSYLTLLLAGATCIAACSSPAADDAAASSEAAQSSDEDCEKPLPDPPSTFNAVALQELQIYKIRDDLGGVSPVPGAFVPVNAEMAIYALNPRTGWCQTSALNFEFIRCDRSKIRINRAPTWQVPGDIMTFMNNVDFQLPDMMIPSVDRSAIAAFGDARTLAPSSIFDIDGNGSFVPRGASVPGGVTVGMYAQRGKWIQSSVWLQLIDVGAPPGSAGTRLAADQCKKKGGPRGTPCNVDTQCQTGYCSPSVKRCAERCSGGEEDPGNCSCDRMKALNAAAHRACDVPRSCSSGDCCADQAAKLAANQQCLSGRSRVVTECYDGGDAKHRQIIADVQRTLDECKRLQNSLFCKKKGERDSAGKVCP